MTPLHTTSFYVNDFDLASNAYGASWFGVRKKTRILVPTSRSKEFTTRVLDWSYTVTNGVMSNEEFLESRVGDSVIVTHYGFDSIRTDTYIPGYWIVEYTSHLDWTCTEIYSYNNVRTSWSDPPGNEGTYTLISSGHEDSTSTYSTWPNGSSNTYNYYRSLNGSISMTYGGFCANLHEYMPQITYNKGWQVNGMVSPGNVYGPGGVTAINVAKPNFGNFDPPKVDAILGPPSIGGVTLQDPVEPGNPAAGRSWWGWVEDTICEPTHDWLHAMFFDVKFNSDKIRQKQELNSIAVAELGGESLYPFQDKAEEMAMQFAGMMSGTSGIIMLDIATDRAQSVLDRCISGAFLSAPAIIGVIGEAGSLAKGLKQEAKASKGVLKSDISAIGGLTKAAKEAERGLIGKNAKIAKYFDKDPFHYGKKIKTYELPHIHFPPVKDQKIALNMDGAWKHKPPKNWIMPTKAREYLEKFLTGPIAPW